MVVFVFDSCKKKKKETKHLKSYCSILASQTATKNPVPTVSLYMAFLSFLGTGGLGIRSPQETEDRMLQAVMAVPESPESPSRLKNSKAGHTTVSSLKQTHSLPEQEHSSGL